jgi:RNA polymerase sigma-70 factor (ECF subfamily)
MTGPRARPTPQPEPLSDEEIVRRVRGGERDLYELLMRRHNQRVYRAIRSVMRDEAEIEDVMQQAYVQAYLHLDQFAGLARFSTWLVRIAINEALARSRRNPRLVLVAGRDDGSQEAEVFMNTGSGGRTPEQHAQDREMVLLVERAIDELPEMYRTVMIMREIEGMSTAEVAQALDITEDVVKTRLHRARASLQGRVHEADDLGGAFPFEARRCDRVVGAVMQALADLAPTDRPT